MFRSNVFPVKSGFSRARKKKGRGKKKKNGGRIAGATTLQRFSTAILCFVCTRLRGVSRCKEYKKISPSSASSQQLATTSNFLFPPPPLKKQRNDTQIFPEKTLPLFLPKIYLLPRGKKKCRSEPRRRCRCSKGIYTRTHHYVKDATSLVLRRPTRAFLHSRATDSPVNSRQLALSTNS